MPYVKKSPIKVGSWSERSMNSVSVIFSTNNCFETWLCFDGTVDVCSDKKIIQLKLFGRSKLTGMLRNGFERGHYVEFCCGWPGIREHGFF